MGSERQVKDLPSKTKLNVDVGVRLPIMRSDSVPDDRGKDSREQRPKWLSV
jgi:hypothetical protein